MCFFFFFVFTTHPPRLLGDRIAARPAAFWRLALGLVLAGRDVPRFGHPGSFANEAGCVTRASLMFRPGGGSRRFSAKDAGGCVFTVNSHGLIRYCFEATWHALLGEPFYGYTPPFKVCIVLMLFIFIFDQSGIKRK